jgi:hypothetical protein
MQNKENVGYDDEGGSGAQKCETCVYFVDPDRCRQVAGEINPDGICDLFERDTYKTASLSLFKGFAEKLATPQRGRIVSDSSLIMDNDLEEDPALRARGAKSQHTHAKPETGRLLTRTYQHELGKNQK